jgi:catecholate siderophore receptor
MTEGGRWSHMIGTSLIMAGAMTGISAAPAWAQDSTPSQPDVAEQLGPVRVTSDAPDADPYADPAAPYKADRLSSSKFTETILNTPRTVTVITKEAIQDRNATALKDILRSTAGVTLGSGEGGNAFGDRFFIRGFDARNDVFIDGVRDPGVAPRENFNVEQVEILRGPASSFAGRGTTGGALNIVTKHAQDADFLHIEGIGGFNDKSGRGTFDVNRKLSDTIDVRLNGVLQYSKVAGRDYASDNRWGIAAAVTIRPVEGFRIEANYSHTYLWGLPDFGVPYDQVTRQPVTEEGIRRDQYYGIVNRDFTRSTQDLGTVNLVWDVNDNVTLENNFRASHSLLDYLGTTPENPSATNAATAPFSSTATHNSGYVQLNAQSRYAPVTVIADQPQATFKFGSGPVKNTLVVGGEFSSEKISLDSYTGFTSELTTGPVVITSTGAPIVPVNNPTNFLFGSQGPSLTGNPLRYHITTKAGFITDTLNYNDIVIVNGGIRYDDYHIASSNNTSARTADNGIWSYNAGVVFKPLPIASIYAAFATAAEPVGAEIDSTSSPYGGLAPTQNATQIFGPQRSRSYEIGMKWEVLDRHLLLTASAFQTNVSNARETAAAGLPGYTTGQIVPNAAYTIKGIDIEASGKLTQNWSVLGGLVLMKTRVTQSINPNNVGLQLANIAPQSFNLLTKYQVTRWLELGGQSIYSSEIKGGSSLAANGNVAYPALPRATLLPSHWRFDLFAEAQINARISAKIYVQNIANKTYYDSFYQSAQPFILVAPGRSVSLSVDLKL